MLQIYDKNHNKIRGLINYKDLKIESELTSENASLSFLISLKDSKGIEHEGYIRTKTQEYVIKEAPLKDKWNEVVADLNLEELKGNPIRNFDSTEQTIDKCIELAIAGSGYTVEIKDNITKKRTVRATDTNSLELLTSIKETYLVEMEFYTIDKKIYVYEQIGSDKGAYFMDSLNLRSLEVTGDSYEFFTKLIAYGATNQETGKTLKVEVTNNTYSSKVTAVIWKDERYTNEESLRADAQYKLDEIAKPKKSYAASIYDLANMNEKYKNILDYKLGDTVTVIDKEKRIKEKLRIVKITEYPLSKEDNEVELSNAVFTFDQLVKSQKKYENTVNNITADNGTVSPDAIKNSVLSLINVNIQSLSAVSARIGELFTNQLKADVANISTGIVGKLLAGKAEIDDLVASKIKFDIAEGGSLSVKDLLAKFLSAGSTETLHLTAGNVAIDDAVIKSAMIDSISADKITAGVIDGNKVTLTAEKDGYKLVQTGRLYQWFKKIEDKYVLIAQMGFDASNNFTWAIKDDTGTYTVYDQNGITKNAVPDGLIVNDMVADNANIAGSKLDIDSVIKEVNDNGTETLKGSKILVDGTEQTVDVAFKELTTTVNNLEVVGVNHALETSTSAEIISGFDDSVINQSAYMYKVSLEGFKLGDKITVSGILSYEDITRSTTTDYHVMLQGKGDVTGWNSGNFPPQYFDNDIDWTTGTGEIDFSYSVTLNEYHLQNSYWETYIRLDYINATKITLSKFKVEKGDRTEWQPSPLDLGIVNNTLQTSLKIEQGKIEQLIKDTTIIENDTKKTLKDAYNETKSTVDSTVQTVASHDTKINDINGDIASMEQRVNSVEVKTTDEAFTVQVQKNQNKLYNIRYIRDYLQSSNKSDGNHWCEIKALTNIGTNLALNKTVTSNYTLSNGTKIVDGNTSSAIHADGLADDSYLQYVQIDLDQVYSNIDELKIWHYYADGRTYHNTKTEVSADGINWTVLFDSAVSGEYPETIYGHSIKVNGTSFNASTVTINELGLHVKNGAIDIQNNAGTKVLEADTKGNLTIRGTFEQYDLSTGIKSVEINNNEVRLYDWSRNGDYVGGLCSTRVEGINQGRIFLYGDTGNPLMLGIASKDGTASKLYPYIVLRDNDEYANSINFLENTAYCDYADINFYGNDYSAFLGKVLVSSSNNLFIATNAGAQNSVRIGRQDAVGTTLVSMLDITPSGITVHGDMTCNGSKPRTVKTKDFGWRSLEAYETTEHYFGDLMFAYTNNKCLCKIYFDKVFLQTVNTKIDYHVFCSAYGSLEDDSPRFADCIETNEKYFVIRTNKPNTKVSVEVKCKQLGYENSRLVKRDLKNNIEEVIAK